MEELAPIVKGPDEYAVGTFNMSFMSDQGDVKTAQYASEATFLNLLKDHKDARHYWKRSLKMLRDFIVTECPMAIGLQEMNLTYPGARTGSAAVDKMLGEINAAYGKKYMQVCMQVPGQFAGTWPAVSVVLNADVVGFVSETRIVNNPLSKGRPLLMVLTCAGNLLICVHGAQDPNLGKDMSAFNEYMTRVNAKFIQEEAAALLNGRSVKNVFVMGDLNDRYDAINNLNIGGKNVRYRGESPYSCCHNWDSSCVASRHRPFGRTRYGTCDIDTKTDPRMQPPTKINFAMGEEGLVENYRYKGDKVFGQWPVGRITMFGRQDKHATSKESDHELVYAKFRLSNKK